MESEQLNPYEPPNSESGNQSHARHLSPLGEVSPRGPALIITMGFVIGVMFTAMTFSSNPLLGLTLMAASTVIAGLAYRRSTQNFPHKSGIRLKQVFFSSLAFLPLFTSIGLKGTHSSNAGFITLLFAIGASIAAGIFASGTRREARN